MSASGADLFCSSEAPEGRLRFGTQRIVLASDTGRAVGADE